MKHFYMLLVAIAMTLSMAAQSKMSPMTKSFLNERSEIGQEALMLRSYSKSLSMEDNEQIVSLFIHFNDEINYDLLESFGVIVDSRYDNLLIVSARVKADKISALASCDEIKYVEIATNLHCKMDLARPMSKVDMIHNPSGQLTKAYTGKGVVVGVVDVGFQYTHPAFYSGSYAKNRILSVWEQGYRSSSATSPVGYKYGTEWSTTKQIEDRGYDLKRSDAAGHATHVSNIAAGSDKSNGNKYYGVASDADLIFVSYSHSDASTVALTDAVSYIFKKAEKLQKPAVVNLSLGTHIGPHDGTSTTDRILDELQGPGKIICGAAGNEDGDKFHVSKSFNAEDTILRTMISFDDTQVNYSTVDIWGDKEKSFEIKLVVTRYKDKSIIYESRYFDASLVKDTTIKLSVASDVSKPEDIKVKGKVQLVTELNPLNNKPHANLFSNISEIPSFGYNVGFVIKSTDGTVHAWADDQFSSLSNQLFSDWEDGNAEYSVGEIGGTSKRVITVGAYVTRVLYSGTLGDKAPFSSVGPTADGRVKPDITAPGASIISAVPNTYTVTLATGFQAMHTTTYNDTKFYYAHMQGTSMSCPFVTGVVATWLEADPTLTPEKIKEVFTKTANKDRFTGYDVPNNKFGYGKINAYAGLMYVLGLSTSTPSVDLPSAMMVYPNPTSGQFNIGFIKEQSNVDVMVYSLNGQVVMQQHIDHVNQGLDMPFDLSNVDNGAYIVRVSGDSYNETFRILVTK